MATFQARIEDKIGDIPLLGGDSDDSQQAITDALTDSASEILDIISEEYLWASVAVTSDAKIQKVFIIHLRNLLFGLGKIEE